MTKEHEPDKGKFLFTIISIIIRVSGQIREHGAENSPAEMYFNGKVYKGKTNRAVVQGHLIAERFDFENGTALTETASSEHEQQLPTEEPGKGSTKPCSAYCLYGEMPDGPVSIKVISYLRGKGGLGFVYCFKLPQPNSHPDAFRMVTLWNPQENPFTEQEQRDIAAALEIGL